MYQDYVRTGTKSRELSLSDPKQEISNRGRIAEFSFLTFPIARLVAIVTQRPLGALPILTLFVIIICGCGGVNYSRVGTSSGNPQANEVALSGVSCGVQSLTGPQAKSCSVSLSSAALSQITVSLSTSNAALKVPSGVTIAVGQSSANFDAVSASVSQAAAVTISASYSGVIKSAALTLYPAGTGSQTSAQHQVQLKWDAPSASGITVIGYNVYRATSGISNYALLNPTINSSTTYLDAAVQSGSTYSYVVKSVDINGAESNPSNSTQVKIP